MAMDELDRVLVGPLKQIRSDQLVIVSENVKQIQTVLEFLSKELPEEYKSEWRILSPSLSASPLDFEGYEVSVDAGESFGVFVGKTNDEAPYWSISVVPTDADSEFPQTDYILQQQDTLVVVSQGQDHVAFLENSLDVLELDAMHARNVSLFIIGAIHTLAVWKESQDNV